MHTWEQGRLVLQVSGVVDENADLSPLAQARADEIVVDLGELRRINSFGVRAWMTMLEQIPAQCRLRFVHCPSPVIDQCNVISGFLGHGIVESFFAPMICETCDERHATLFDTAACIERGGKLPHVSCPRCARAMELDDLEEHYLAFLRDALPASPAS